MKKLFYFANLLTLTLLLSVSESIAQPTLSLNPVSDTVCPGATAKFFAASTDTAVHFYWEVYSTIWDSLLDGPVYSGATTDTVTFTANLSMDGYYYRVKAYNGAGMSAYSPYVPLRVKHAGTISGPDTVCPSTTITLTTTGVGGTWHTLNGHASISAGGVVSAVSTGVDTILYISDPACSADTAWYTVTVAPPTTVGTITGTSLFCVGASATYTTPGTGGTWNLSNGNASITGTNTITADARGLDTLTYSVTNGCGTFTSPAFVITIDTALAHATISGASAICTTTPVTLTADISGGNWSATNSTATISGSGLLTGVISGIDTIKYINTNICNSDTAMHIVTISAPLTAGSIAGSSSVCRGVTTTLSSSVPGGSWSSANGNTTVSSVGVVTGVNVGLDTITYSVTNTCGTFSSAHPMVIDTTLAHASISGASAVCISSTITLSADVVGGAWSVTNSRASVSTAGAVTGAAAGMDTIKYTNTNGCSSDVAMHVVTVEAPLTTGSISGASFVCQGSVTTLSSSVTGGTWSVSNGHATISSTGVVSGVSYGLDTVTYSVSNSCGVTASTHILAIDTLLGHASIAGASAVCIGSFISLSASISGGVWSVTNSSASVDTVGMVVGLATGIDTVMYTNTGRCNVDVAMRVVTVDAPLTAGTIAGASSGCAGSTVAFSATATGGSWTSSNTAVAVVDGSGVVTGRGVGTAVISYTFANSCGSVSALDTIAIFRTASAIVGRDSVGIGNTITLTDSASGGTWSSSDTTIATISSTGLVLGRDTGTTTITYMVTNICGTSWAAKTIAVGPTAPAGVVYGPDSVCAGSSILMRDTLVGGGVWSVTNSNATINDTGLVTGITGGTIDTVLYTVTTGFGASVAMKEIRISSTPPAVTVTGPDTASLGVGTTSFHLVGRPAGGTFTSLNPTNVVFTTVNGDFVILRRGVTLLTYTYTNACGTGKDTFVVYLPLPNNVNDLDESASMLNVYPNPNSGTFSLNLISSYNEQAHVVVSNAIGQVVREFNIATNRVNEIEMNNPAGLYLINATTSHGKVATRVTITE